MCTQPCLSHACFYHLRIRSRDQQILHDIYNVICCAWYDFVMCRFSHFQRHLVTMTYSTDSSVMLGCPLLWHESTTLGFLYVLFFLPILTYTAQLPFTTLPRSYLPHSDSHSCFSNIIQTTRESPPSSACVVWSINHCLWFAKEGEVDIFPVAQKKDHSNSDYPSCFPSLSILGPKL